MEMDVQSTPLPSVRNIHSSKYNEKDSRRQLKGRPSPKPQTNHTAVPPVASPNATSPSRPMVPVVRQTLAPTEETPSYVILDSPTAPTHKPPVIASPSSQSKPKAPTRNRQPAGPPKQARVVCEHYDATPARLMCQITHTAQDYPIPAALVSVLLLFIIVRCCCCCGSHRSALDRGEYRAIAASMTDDAFADDISFGDEYLSDDDDLEAYGNGGIQLSTLAKDGGLDLDEMNG